MFKPFHWNAFLPGKPLLKKGLDGHLGDEEAAGCDWECVWWMGPFPIQEKGGTPSGQWKQPWLVGLYRDDYTTHLYRDYNKPWQGSLLAKQYNWRRSVFFVAKVSLLMKVWSHVEMLIQSIQNPSNLPLLWDCSCPRTTAEGVVDLFSFSFDGQNFCSISDLDSGHRLFVLHISLKLVSGHV